MAGFAGSSATPVYRRVMIFIDGGYLRKSITDIFHHDKIDFNRLVHDIRGNFSGPGVAEVIRTFYYDANVDPKEDMKKHDEFAPYFENVRGCPFYEVKLARLVKDGKGYKQKGVDVLLAIDMIKKAYEDQYDFAIIIAGDDDFVDVVQAVKDTGKRVIGFFFENSISKRLLDAFDHRVKITPQMADHFIVKS